MVRSDGPSLHVSLLGRFQVAVGDAFVPPGRWKRRSAAHLIKLLALQPERRAHRDVVMSHLWPESPEASAANSLYKSVHAARRALESVAGAAAGSTFLEMSHQFLTLSAPGGVLVDAEAFDRYAAAAFRAPGILSFERALELYRGDLLFEDLDTEWVEARRDQLRAVRERLLFGLAELHGKDGHREAALEALGQLLVMDPANEEAHRRAMLVHAEASDVAGALRQFEFCRLALRRELDVEPDARTLSLFRAIAAGDVRTQSRVPGESGIDTIRHRPRHKARSLPLPVTSFVGRASEVAEAADLVLRSRLVTITGIGGVGKSRFAIRVAETVAHEFPDGVALVELSPIADPSFVASLVASEFGIEEQTGHPLLETICDSIRELRMLVVLDNCEHVPQASADVVGAILRVCPHVRFLCTSRLPLGAGGEVQWNLAPLETPVRSSDAFDDSVGRSDALQLFANRARQSDPAFAVTKGNIDAVAELCRRVDGIPLAIEFAAARIRSLSVAEMLEHLDNRYTLSTEAPGVPDRQRTLHDVLDWSFAHLRPSEQRLLRSLALFAGGWTLGAAESVCAAGGEDADSVLAGLGQLVDASLVVPSVGDRCTRYRMLETVRRYGLDELRRSEELLEVRSRYRGWLIGLASDSERMLKGSTQAVWLDLLEAEHDNIRAVLDRQESDIGCLDRLRLCSSLAHFWAMRGHWSEGLSQLELALSGRDGAPQSEVASALHGAGVLEQRLTNYERSLVLLEESLSIRRELGDLRAVAETLGFIGHVLLRRGDTEAARTSLEESATVAERAGDVWVLAFARNQLGTLAGLEGDNAAALAAHDRSQALYREVGDWNRVASALNNVATIESRLGRTSKAVVLYREALEFLGSDGDTKTMAVVLNNLGLMCSETGRGLEARGYFERCIDVTMLSGDRAACSLAHANLAELLEASGESEPATRHARACLHLAPALDRDGVRDRAVRVLEAVSDVQP